MIFETSISIRSELKGDPFGKPLNGKCMYIVEQPVSIFGTT